MNGAACWRDITGLMSRQASHSSVTLAEEKDVRAHSNGTMRPMPNIASILKAEISRVARKEVRAEIETLKKASIAHRASIAELRQQVNALEKELRRVAKGATRSTTAVDSDNEASAGTKRRFSATRLAAHRSKLGLSAASYGQLVGVSGQTIYHWEQGKARPRAAQLESLATVRSLGAREVAERLAA